MRFWPRFIFRPSRPSLSRQVNVVLIPGLVLLLGLAGLYQSRQQRSLVTALSAQSEGVVARLAERTAADRRLAERSLQDSVADVMAEVAPGMIAADDVPGLQSYADILVKAPDVVAVQFVAMNGKVVAGARASGSPAERAKFNETMLERSIETGGQKYGTFRLVVIDRQLRLSIDAGRLAANEAMAASSQAAAASLDHAEATMAAGTVGLAILMAVMSALVLRQQVTRPLQGMTGAMQKLAEHELEVSIPGMRRRDEIGRIAAAVAVFKDSMIRADLLASQQEKDKETAAAAQKSALNRTADAFETTIGGLVSMLAAAAAELRVTAETMSGTAGRTNGQAATMTSAAETASAAVQMVSAAAGQIALSINEIRTQVTQSTRIIDLAVQEVGRTDEIVAVLVEQAKKIGQVVGLIDTIAGQTNMLALNATIEAARAGESGKAFGVVATEVKALAQQTTQSTAQIGDLISQVQGATTEAVMAMGGIRKTVGEVSAIATAIASAIEQQGCATAQIAQNVEQTTASTRIVTLNIGSVSAAVSETGEAAGEVLSAAGALSRQAEQLTRQVNLFVENVRAA